MAKKQQQETTPAIGRTLEAAIASLGFGPWITASGKADLKKFRWPPDVFGMAAAVLRDSGAYLQAARPHDWKEGAIYDESVWSKFIIKQAAKWKVLRDSQDPPPSVSSLLHEIADLARPRDRRRAPLRLHELSRPAAQGESNLTWLPFLTLLAIADEACVGVGMIMNRSDASSGTNRLMRSAVRHLSDYYERQAQLASSDINASEFHPLTLGKRLDPTQAIVMPKMRTSQRGITIRSFSHHLALLQGSDVEPIWHSTPYALLASNTRPHSVTFNEIPDVQKVLKKAGPYHFILFPWPLELRPSQFRALDKPVPSLGNRPGERDKMFTFKHCPLPQDFGTKVNDLITRASHLVGPIHGLILPEMAMTRADFNEVFKDELPAGIDLLVCGVYEPDCGLGLGRNYAVVRRRDEARPAPGGEVGRPSCITVEQQKHHRWALDAQQICSYSLGGSLKPALTWWEAIDLRRRSINFFALDGSAAFSVLICEDLARPDPVGDAVRAVGPNLVICLLMDGPQLKDRWSARYATVLADDPGSSVLTLSSLGMVKLSRRLDQAHVESRVIALWRESAGQTLELQLPDGYDALVLSLVSKPTLERTIDGRPDGDAAMVLSLGGVQPIKFGR